MRGGTRKDVDWEGSSDGGLEPAHAGDAYHALLKTLPSNKDMMSVAGRAPKRRKTAASGEGLAKLPKASSCTCKLLHSTNRSGSLHLMYQAGELSMGV